VASRTISMDDRIYDYLLSVSVREPPVLSRLREETQRHPMARMQLAPEQGQFLALLVQLIGARSTLEVGVFTGYSSLSVALALPPEGSILACDVSEEWTSVARRYWREAGVEEKIDLRIAPALETLDCLLAEGRGESFDFAFIDADKESYGAYYERCLALSRPGGLLAVDNTLWNGKVADSDDRSTATVALREFNAMVHADERVAISLVPIGDGLTLAMKR